MVPRSVKSLLYVFSTSATVIGIVRTSSCLNKFLCFLFEFQFHWLLHQHQMWQRIFHMSTYVIYCFHFAPTQRSRNDTCVRISKSFSKYMACCLTVSQVSLDMFSSSLFLKSQLQACKTNHVSAIAKCCSGTPKFFCNGIVDSITHCFSVLFGFAAYHYIIYWSSNAMFTERACVM